MLLLLFLLCAGVTTPSWSYPSIGSIGNEDILSETQTTSDRDDAVSRKVLGSSVVTSVSVIMDTGSEKHYADAVGRPQAKPQAGSQVASPINLLNPDRYEFYTFNDSGDLVKRLMTLSEIQGIIANADGDAFNQNAHSPEKKVDDVVNNVQNVLKSEMEKNQNTSTNGNMVLDTPDVSSSWSVILPAIFGNSGEEIKPAKPQTSNTPETIMLEHQTVSIVKKPAPFRTKATTTTSTTTTEVPIVTVTVTETTRRPSSTVTTKKSPSQTSKTKATHKPSSTLKLPTTTKKPIKVSPSKKVTVRTTPSTAIPRITTRGTRPSTRRTTTPIRATTTQRALTTTPDLGEDTQADVLERVKHTTPSSTTLDEASSHFIQLFEPLIPQSSSPYQQSQGSTTRIPATPVGSRPSSRPSSGPNYGSSSRPSSGTTYTRLPVLTTPSQSQSQKVPIGALFIIDEKTNTKIPITTKEQLTTLLNKLESTTELFKNSPIPVEGLNGVNFGEPLITFNSLIGNHNPNPEPNPNLQEEPIATTSNIQSTTAKIDDDKYQQLLLTSTNIYEINKELAKSTTMRPVTNTITKVTVPHSTTTSQKVSDATHDILSSTIKEPNLVNSIEQLIQQAVGNIQESQKVTPQQSIKITTITTATPEITTVTEESETTPATEIPTGSSGGLSADALFSEAMGSLLSQVVSSDFQGLTTLQELPSTTEILNKPSGENLEYRIKTTDIFSETTDSTTDDTTDVKTTTDNFERVTGLAGDEISKTTNFNEILKTDASTYGQITDTTKEDVEQEITTETTATTTEIVKDLPIVFNLGLEAEDQQEESSSTTTEEKVLSTTTSDPLEDEVKSTTSFAEETIGKDNSETTLTPTKESPQTTSEAISEATTSLVDNDNTGTTEELTEKNVINDSDTLPSTNSYKELPANTIDSDVVPSEQTTLSIEELLKELTSKNEGQGGPKETTVLIITKPLYNTTPTTPRTSTTTIASTTSLPETSTVVLTNPPTTFAPFTYTPNSQKTTLQQSFTILDNTEAIAADAITSIDEATTTSASERPDVESTSTLPGADTPTKEPEWTIVSTIAPHNLSTPQNTSTTSTSSDKKPTETENKLPQPPKPVELVPMPQLGGLEETTKNLDQDIYQFVGLCNELAFGFWKSVTTGISTARSVVLSPFAATSLLAMVFLGARGATSGEMNEILRLDDMVSFNPHLIFKNVSESIEVGRKEGVATSVILRELYSDKSKGHLLNFYKERAKAFYDGHVEEVSFKEVGDIIRRRTNLIVKKQTNGKIGEYIKDSTIIVKRPLAGVSASIFQTDCSDASVEGRDGELYFVVLPSIRQRRLVPVPAAVWRSNFLAGYDPGLDATAVALGNKNQVVSTIFVIPGQQGIAAPGDGLARLERHLIGSAFKEKDKSWSRLLQTLIPRPGLEVQIPRFQHRSIINATVALQQMGMKDLFDADKADLRGLNGVANDLYLSDILQINNFATCGEEPIGETHHSEIYPATANRTYRRSRKFKDLLPPDGAFYDSDLSEEPRDYQRAFHDPLHDPSLYSLPLPLRPRQARLPDPPRLRFDRPFLYFVRHNPTGLILHMGRFNPRLLP